MPNPKPEHSEEEKRRFNRLRTLRQVGAPKWIIKHEQVKLIKARQGLQEDRQDLLQKYVLPILGQDS